VALADRVVSQALPSMQAFAAMFAGLLGVMALHAAARGVRPGSSSTPLILVTGIAAVATCITATTVFLVKHPAAAGYFPPPIASSLAVLLAGFAWFVLFPPSGLTASRTAGWLAIVAALILASGFVATARLSVHTLGGPIIWYLFAPGVVLFLCSSLTARFAGSFHAGLQTAVWGAVLGSLMICALFLPETMHRFALDGRTLGDGESGYPIGVNLQSSIWVLIQVPVFGFPFGVFGAAVGSRWVRHGYTGKGRRTRTGIVVAGWQWPLGGI
jgi:hypothetical protein